MGKILDSIYQLKAKNQKALAILIDPDNLQEDTLAMQVSCAISAKVDYFFIGGSMITDDCIEETLTYIKSKCNIPCILFPGSVYQISEKADAILFLSLISGRNAELLIGKHVLAAPRLKKSGIEILPTGYMLIDGGAPTTASYISNTFPIPNNKPNIAAGTAMAGEMLGLDINFLDAGSGAKQKVNSAMIKAVVTQTDNPLIVGGGIKNTEDAIESWNAGAQIVVVGNAFENNLNLASEISEAKNSIQ